MGKYLHLDQETFGFSLPVFAGIIYFFGILIFPICYAISFTNEQIRLPSIFLSSAISPEPAASIASFILSPGGLFLAVLGFARYLQVKEEMPKSKLNLAGVSLSTISGFGGHGVGSWPTRAIAFAVMFFGGGAIFLIVTVLLDRKCTFGHPWSKRLRIVGCVVCFFIASALGLVALFGIQLAVKPVLCSDQLTPGCFSNQTDFQQAKDIYDDDGYYYRIVGVVLEVAVYYVWVTSFVSLAFEMRDTQMMLKVVPAQAMVSATTANDDA